MATSPIYSWPEPDNTDLVKNGALAIRTLGNAIDTTMGTMVAKTIIDAKGDLIAGTAADTAQRIAVGANNTVLTADSSTATGLKWAAAAGGGKVLQVVQAVSNTSTEVATSTFTDTTLTASITPTSATSKILVMVQQASRVARSNNENYAPLRLLRGATVVFDTRGTTPVGYGGIGAGGNGLTTSQLTHFQPLIYLDSPATTSATTYKTQGNAYLTSDSGKVTYQWETMASTITLLEIGA